MRIRSVLCPDLCILDLQTAAIRANPKTSEDYNRLGDDVLRQAEEYARGLD